MISFDEFYHKIYGERWSSLKESLGQENKSSAFSEGLKKEYYLDTASLCPPRILNVKPGEKVLDMCAAPGGKTLLLASALQGKGSLTANDRSADRRKRLRQVIENHLPQELSNAVAVTSHDATRWGLYEQNIYDAILLDAPCSSERHVLNSPAHLLQWSPSRPKRLAVQQFAMLAAALDAAKPGGRIVYSTCSISPLENDDVIKKLFKKRKGLFNIVSPDTDTGDETEYGRIILPDVCDGAGPLYFALIKKCKS